jgi:hypothetical protein
VPFQIDLEVNGILWEVFQVRFEFADLLLQFGLQLSMRTNAFGN